MSGFCERLIQSQYTLKERWNWENNLMHLNKNCFLSTCTVSSGNSFSPLFFLFFFGGIFSLKICKTDV